MTIALQALPGSNPLAFFAALGSLAAVDRQAPELTPRLWWDEGIVPRARLAGPDGLDELVDLLEQDRQEWSGSSLLTSGPDGQPMDDIKPDSDGIRSWAELVREPCTARDRRDSDHFLALLAENAVAGKKDAKPTALHFTAGQQKFMRMVRELNEGVTADHFIEALKGPWRYDSEFPALGWDARGERIYALRGTNPSTEKKASVPGAEWLAFVGLAFFPSAKNGAGGTDQLLTTGCRGGWKVGTFHWPMWSRPLRTQVVRSLLSFEGLLQEPAETRAMRGVFRIYESPIRRSDQGGYGSFGPAGEPESVAPRATIEDRRVSGP